MTDATEDADAFDEHELAEFLRNMPYEARRALLHALGEATHQLVVLLAGNSSFDTACSVVAAVDAYAEVLDELAAR